MPINTAGFIKNGTKIKIPAVFVPEPQESVSVTADGVKDYETLLNSLFALVDQTKLTRRSQLTIGDTFHQLGEIPPSGTLAFSGGYAMRYDGGIYTYNVRLHASQSKYMQVYITSAGAVSNNNYGSNVPTVGTEITVYY